MAYCGDDRNVPDNTDDFVETRDAPVDPMKQIRISKDGDAIEVHDALNLTGLRCVLTQLGLSEALIAKVWSTTGLHKETDGQYKVTWRYGRRGMNMEIRVAAERG